MGWKARVDRSGGVVIPKAAREQLQLLEGAQLDVKVEDGRVVLVPVRQTGVERRVRNTDFLHFAKARLSQR